MSNLPSFDPEVYGLFKRGDVVAVVGAAASGFSACKLLRQMGARVRLLEKNPANVSAEFKAFLDEAGFELRTGAHKPEDFSDAALVVTSPGVPLKILEPLLAEAGGVPLVSELELGYLFVGQPILAITGTSGKTTTASLAAAMLEEAGKKVFLGGNIGTPLCEYALMEKKAEVLVLEVSSFQLQACRRFHPRVALLLNLSENHLDQHKDMDEYREAKFRIFMNQNRNDVGIVGDELFMEAQKRNLRCRLEVFNHSSRFPKSRLFGEHNRANMEAAFMAVREFGVTEEAARRAVEKFAPLPHRLEMAGEWGGVLYINDSKCTTVEALRVALQAMELRPTLLLVGGVFKGGDLESLRGLIKAKVKALGLFGASREIFEKAWADIVPASWSPTLREAMEKLDKVAEPGDAMLLAPATSSFDLYANYKERGKDFMGIAKQLGAARLQAADAATRDDADAAPGYEAALKGDAL